MGSAPRYEDIRPGLASRRAPLEAEHRGAVRKLWLWVRATRQALAAVR